MVLYNIEDVHEGMVLGRSVFLPNGDLLLAAGFKLTERLKTKLIQMGFTSLYIQEEGTEDVEPETIISDHVQREVNLAVKKSTVEIQSVFKIRQDGSKSIRTLLKENKQYLNKFLTNTGLINALEKMIDEIMSQPSIVLNMTALQKQDKDLFSHAINVTITSLAIGRKYHFSYEEMKQLALGAINYDLGLIAVPKDIIEKVKIGEKLSNDEEELFKQHTVYGYLMLAQNPSISATSSAVALQHHEYQNGTGYPRKLKGENLAPLKDFSRKNMIHRFAEIVAVADYYDMLTTGRMQQREYSVVEAIKKLIELSGDYLNSHIVKTLTTIVPIYPVGARFKIVNSPVAQLIGYYGVVAKINPDKIEKPVIIIYQNRKREKIKPILLDLGKHNGFSLEILT